MKKSPLAVLLLGQATLVGLLTSLFPSSLRSSRRWFRSRQGINFYARSQTFQKANISFVMPASLSVRMEQLCSHWTDFH